MFKKLEILNPDDKFVVIAKITFLSLFFVPAIIGFVFNGILENDGETALTLAIFGLLAYASIVIMSNYSEDE